MATNPTIRYWYNEIVTALFVLLLLYTAIMKLSDIEKFIYTLRSNTNEQMQTFAPFIGWAVPLTELVICALLFIPATRRKGLVAATILMALFAWYVAYMLATQSKLPCTCGGVIESMNWRQHLAFNSAFVLLGLTTLLSNPTSFFAKKNRSRRIPAENSRQSLTN